MLEWLTLHWGTILVCAILIAIVTAILLKLRKDRKAGKSSCGCNCKTCGGACHACKTPCDKS